jgi:MFS family permease
LLLGGRIGDLFGRKRTVVGGAIGFAVASAFGGAAQSFDVLVAARALQGGFAALLAPAALSLLTTTFSDPGERGKAFAVWGAPGSGPAARAEHHAADPSCRARSSAETTRHSLHPTMELIHNRVS